VALGKVERSYAEKAAEAAGYRVRKDQRGFVAQKPGMTITFGAAGATLSTGLSEEQALAYANEFKRSYANEVIKAASTRFGWRLTETTPKAKTKSGARLAYQAQRRF
jgi:hypothetical protein